jgi:hypothetical protein
MQQNQPDEPDNRPLWDQNVLTRAPKKDPILNQVAISKSSLFINFR